ncbi:cbb3-type cytochrome c oxidase N-terminal domain-containing protein [Lacihabitans sp. CS3-21]|uniref:cbb3-type cytochrome c oxidase N-terminal domain-containing protein n=1 Tax=Lacihabitans sp. CS3-21 TaxID=2487332 RepID=UPI0020CD9BF2|nr:cbb3-type cytochrome c oxidase N-terminal domain-containing protein [Lacihabitans sp. CS3-21]MCP9748216.1 cytochrome oxidase subunit III [Lacihabitans sp. CS3-21]
MDLSFKTGEELFQFILLGVLLIFTVILFIVVMNIFMLLKKLNLGASGSAAADAVEETSFWKSLTNAVPIAKEETVLLDHNYDGIRELDNHLPPWWLGLLYGSIVFAIVYLLNYHVWHWSPSQEQEYTIAMDEGKKEVEAYQAKLGESIDEKSVKVLADAKTIENGKTIYTEKCVACHGAAGEGGVGPNLTDEYWLHGGTINDVFGVIKNGVPEKGMISWKATLKPGQIQEVSNFIMTLKGTNPANPKAPQGEKVGDVAAATTSGDSTQAK